MCSSSKQHIENANSHYNYNNYNDLEGKPYPATDIKLWLSQRPAACASRGYSCSGPRGP